MSKQEILKDAEFEAMTEIRVDSIPAHEAWLFKNKRASALVQRGLEDAKQGRLVKPKEDFSRYLKR